jgi:Ca2+-binding EF-hand superfamily protein
MVKEIFSRATAGPDGSRTKFLSFSQFILAGVNHQKSILTNHYLNLAFQLFDCEGLGLIDAQGINAALGSDLIDAERGEFEKVIRTVNSSNGEGEQEESISFEAFILHMK